MAEEELKVLVKSLFEDFLDVVGETDSGNPFRPTQISTVQALQVEPLNKLLSRMRELVGVEQSPIVVKPASPKKVCPKKVNGVCPLPNLFCAYPACEK